MNEALDGAATLTAMVIRLESERDAAIVRAERAEAAVRTALDSKEFFRVCWEKAEAELAAVPIDALRQIAECERRLLPPTPHLIALNAWLATLPSDNDLSPDDPAA